MEIFNKNSIKKVIKSDKFFYWKRTYQRICKIKKLKYWNGGIIYGKNIHNIRKNTKKADIFVNSNKSSTEIGLKFREKFVSKYKLYIIFSAFIMHILNFFSINHFNNPIILLFDFLKLKKQRSPFIKLIRIGQIRCSRSFSFMYSGF